MGAGPFDLTDRVVLVTGAAQGGLGAGAALALAAQGARVVAADRGEREADLATTVARVHGAGGQGLALHCDITRERDVEALVEAAHSEWDRLDALVHCAGVMLRRDVFSTSVAEWQRVIDTNLTGTWLIDRAAGRFMTAAGRGKIVNVSSIYGSRSGPLPESAYYASKAGVENLTRALAAEFGTAGVNVNCIAPGVFYPTSMTQPLAEDPRRLEWMKERTLLKTLGRPDEDIGGVVVLLASSAADYITGQVIHVDGGWSAW